MKMNKFVIYSLRVTAASTSATSAIVAYPAASSMFGPIAGAVGVGSCAAAIYAGWHFIGSEQTISEKNSAVNSIVQRVIAGSVSIMFASALVAGIHASASQPEQSQNNSLAASNDALYKQQETSRMKALADHTDELRVTSKKKNPVEYKSLQRQIDKLSTPTERPVKQAVSGNSPRVYSWIAAAAFEVVTPALLILAGLFARREQLEITANNSAVNAVVATVDTDAQVIEKIELTQLPEPITSVSEDDIQDAISNKTATVNTDGNVTATAIVDATGCTARQSRSAVKKAVENGYLIKTGAGGATRYSYPRNANIRSIK